MPRTWKPYPEDAISLAAFRWLANTIENFAIELYATDRGSFDEVEGVLRNTLKELQHTRRNFAVSPEDCPDGYVLCHGICAPSCEVLAEASAVKAVRQQPVKPARGKGKR